MSEISPSCFAEHARGIDYVEIRSLTGFAALASASLVSLTFCIGMVASTPWSPVQMGLLWPAVFALAFAGFAALMGLLAVAALQPQQLHFDANTRRVCGRGRGRLWLPRQVSADFGALQPPTVSEHERESQGPLYQIRLALADEPALQLGGFDERAAAEHWCARLARLIKG